MKKIEDEITIRENMEYILALIRYANEQLDEKRTPSRLDLHGSLRNILASMRAAAEDAWWQLSLAELKEENHAKDQPAE